MGIWFVLVWFNCFVLFSNKEFYGLMPSGLMLLSLIFSIFFGMKMFRRIQLNWFDYFCLGLTIILIGYWIIFRNTLNTVILTALVDFIAFLPTFKKWWIAPWTESILVYFMSAMGQIFTLLSLSGFQDLENMIFWWYLFFANLIFFFMVVLRRYTLKWWKSIFE